MYLFNIALGWGGVNCIFAELKVPFCEDEFFGSEPQSLYTQLPVLLITTSVINNPRCRRERLGVCSADDG